MDRKTEDIYVLETDGSYNPNLEYAGIGGVLYKNGQLIDCFSVIVQLEPVNHEATALLYGLLLAKQHGANNIICKSDSLTNIKYFKNTDDNKTGYTDILYDIEDIIEDFDSVNFEHQFRENNRSADFLSSLYKMNGGCSVYHPLKIQHEFWRAEYIVKNNFQINKSQKPLQLSYNISDDDNKNTYFNIIEYDSKTNILKYESSPIENDITSITNKMYTFLLDKKTKENLHVVFSGLYAEVIRVSLVKQRAMGYTLNQAFINLAPQWQMIDKSLIQKNAIIQNRTINKDDTIELLNYKKQILNHTHTKHIIFNTKNVNVKAKEQGKIKKISKIMLEIYNVDTETNQAEYFHMFIEPDAKSTLKKIIKTLRSDKYKNYNSFYVKGTHSDLITGYFMNVSPSKHLRQEFTNLSNIINQIPNLTYGENVELEAICHNILSSKKNNKHNKNKKTSPPKTIESINSVKSPIFKHFINIGIEHIKNIYNKIKNKKMLIN